MTALLQFEERDLFDDCDDGLRWYQREIALAAVDVLQEVRSALIVAATGLGKTQVFSAIAGDTRGRVLVLCHREELVEQARRRLEQMTGEWVQVEQGQHFAELTTRIVVASIDTLRRKRRLERFPADHFSLIIVDEAHHYVGNTYVKPLEYFTGAKVLGVTATPNRADERALGMTFDKVAYVMDIAAGIDHGYLVPLRGQLVTLEEIDLSEVGKSGQDLKVGQLDEAMLRAVEGVVRETIRLEPTRQGIAFFPGVKSAQYACEKWNALQPGSARFISGETPTDERRRIVADFKRGDFRILCNCMVATEGFDAPGVSLIIMARPTLSAALYAQMIGRGTRTLAHVVDAFLRKEEDAERRAAIAASDKPDCMILDFVGNSGKHQLITLEDVLGGKYTDAEVRIAKKKRASCDGDPRAALEAARAELRAMAQKLEAKVKSEVQHFDPFKAFHVERQGIVHERDERPMSDGQRSYLLALGVTPQELRGVHHDDAQKLIATANKRKQLGLATYKQLRCLEPFGIASPNLSLYRASAALNYISSKHWGRNNLDPVDPKVLERIVHYQRQPGEDG